MVYSLSRVDDREFATHVEVNARFGKTLPKMEVKLLQVLLDCHFATRERLHDCLWPDADGFDVDFNSNLRVHISRLRKTFGDLIDLQTIWGQGYILKRLGPKDNPMYERKAKCR